MHNTAINMENMGKRRFTPPRTGRGRRPLRFVPLHRYRNALPVRIRPVFVPALRLFRRFAAYRHIHGILVEHEFAHGNNPRGNGYLRYRRVRKRLRPYALQLRAVAEIDRFQPRTACERAFAERLQPGRQLQFRNSETGETPCADILKRRRQRKLSRFLRS